MGATLVLGLNICPFILKQTLGFSFKQEPELGWPRLYFGFMDQILACSYIFLQHQTWPPLDFIFVVPLVLPDPDSPQAQRFLSIETLPWCFYLEFLGAALATP